MLPTKQKYCSTTADTQRSSLLSKATGSRKLMFVTSVVVLYGIMDAVDNIKGNMGRRILAQRPLDISEESHVLILEKQEKIKDPSPYSTRKLALNSLMEEQLAVAKVNWNTYFASSDISFVASSFSHSIESSSQLNNFFLDMTDSNTVWLPYLKNSSDLKSVSSVSLAGANVSETVISHYNSFVTPLLQIGQDVYRIDWMNTNTSTAFFTYVVGDSSGIIYDSIMSNQLEEEANNRRMLLASDGEAFRWIWGGSRGSVDWHVQCVEDGTGGYICNGDCTAALTFGTGECPHTFTQQGVCCTINYGWAVATPLMDITIGWNSETLQFEASVTGIGTSFSGGGALTDCCETDPPSPTPSVAVTTSFPTTSSPTVETPTDPPTCPPSDDPGAQCDPIILGIDGQVFKFAGRNGAWYSNLAVPDASVQWNTLFNRFPDCPADQDTFIGGSGISIAGEEILIEVEDKDSFFPGCPEDETTCLGDGSLSLVVNGKKIRSPGEYPLKNGGSVIVHNTYAACSRKWFDFVPESHRALRAAQNHENQDFAIELLKSKKKTMIDPKECSEWIQDRIVKNDLFDQQGGWSTIHIVTPEVSFHMEYRQTREVCYSHVLDSWISNVSPNLLKHQWKGILGETRYPKYAANGEQIMANRTLLLDGKFDLDYEVEGAFGTQFAAMDLSLMATVERKLSSSGCWFHGRAL